MTVAMPRRTVEKLLRCCQVALLAGGAGTLGYCGFVLGDVWLYQRQASHAFDGLAPHPAVSETPPAAVAGELIGRMEIARLGVSVAIAEGTGEATLRRAAGHIEGTVLPGHPGNVGIAGHRDTLFRPLRNIQKDDVVSITTLQGEYRYRVVSTKIVSPSEVAVLDSDGRDMLTLVTCYPFYFIGPAPGRFIVRAARVA